MGTCDQVYSSFSCQDYNELVTVKQRIELRMVKVHSWVVMNKLKLNNNKTELLVLCILHIAHTFLLVRS